jgi:hypothetical protein
MGLELRLCKRPLIAGARAAKCLTNLSFLETPRWAP